MIVIVVAGIGLFTIFFVKKNLGDVRPAILSPISANPSTSEILDSSVDTYVNDLGFTLPAFLQMEVFANDLPGARDLEMTPTKTILVTLTSQGQLVALNANREKIVLENLNSPHGIALAGNTLFVAATDGVSRFDWNEKNWSVSNQHRILELPSGGGHFTRSLLVKDEKLYVSIGSSCNVCKEKQPWRATIVETDFNGEDSQVFATGLRNSVFMTINPISREIWATDMGRDHLGDDIPSDEINIVKQNKNYGWPICYGNKIHDTSFDKKQYLRDPCEDSTSPVFHIPAHSAPLGLTFINSPIFPREWQGDLLVAYHGSWNRSTPTGYKIVRLKLEGNTVVESEDFITGFLSKGQSSQAIGRPVDLFLTDEALFISDDKAGKIYRVISKDKF